MVLTRSNIHHVNHFLSSVSLGGDVDASSKTLLGVCKTNEDFHFLIAVSHGGQNVLYSNSSLFSLHSILTDVVSD